MEHPEWKDVSASAKAFLQALMSHYPLERPSAQEALQLPWMTERDKGGKAKPKKGPTASKKSPKAKGGLRRTPVSMTSQVCMLNPNPNSNPTPDPNPVGITSQVCMLSMVGKDVSIKGKATPRAKTKANASRY